MCSTADQPLASCGGRDEGGEVGWSSSEVRTFANRFLVELRILQDQEILSSQHPGKQEISFSYAAEMLAGKLRLPGRKNTTWVGEQLINIEGNQWKN